jgi:hypothetical protein
MNFIRIHLLHFRLFLSVFGESMQQSRSLGNGSSSCYCYMEVLFT